jgi:hypothetical protein
MFFTLNSMFFTLNLWLSLAKLITLYRQDTTAHLW